MTGRPARSGTGTPGGHHARPTAHRPLCGRHTHRLRGARLRTLLAAPVAWTDLAAGTLSGLGCATAFGRLAWRRFATKEIMS